LIYPLYLPESLPREYTHAENSYLQIATENGLPGVLLLLAAVGTCFTWCAQAIRWAPPDPRFRLLATAVFTGLLASAVHAVVDFVWFVPACISLAILLAACASRLYQLACPRAETTNLPAPKLAWLSRLNLAVAVALAGMWAIATLLPSASASLAWDRYLLADIASQERSRRGGAVGSGEQDELAEAENLNTAAMIEQLLEVVRRDPHSARARARLAAVLVARFEQLQLSSANAMAISQIRDAAIASRFGSAQELRDWLARACGPHSKLLDEAYRQAHRAVRLCPLQGEAYLLLAELAFLTGQDQSAYDAYAAQTLAVRPHDSELLFTIGKQQLLVGHGDEALALWTKAYRSPGKHQSQIIRILAGHLPAAEFVRLFQPDWRTLPLLWKGYRELGQPHDLADILPHAERMITAAADSLPHYTRAALWLALSRMQAEQGKPEAALTSLQNGFAAYPELFEIRYELGCALLAVDRAEEAVFHLRWCQASQPAHPHINAQLGQATRKRMERLARASNPEYR
jgi:tetratricopeptide (TPR) repeat protein